MVAMNSGNPLSPYFAVKRGLQPVSVPPRSEGGPPAPPAEATMFTAHPIPSPEPAEPQPEQEAKEEVKDAS